MLPTLFYGLLPRNSFSFISIVAKIAHMGGDRQVDCCKAKLEVILVSGTDTIHLWKQSLLIDTDCWAKLRSGLSNNEGGHFIIIFYLQMLGKWVGVVVCFSQVCRNLKGLAGI